MESIHRRRRTDALAAIFVSCLLAFTLGTGTAALATHAPEPLPALDEVAALDTSQIDLASFSGREQAIAPYLGLLAELANSVVDDDPALYGWISSRMWRRNEAHPDNARVMESVLTLAYFYSVDRPWNPYHDDPALKSRLEAALGYWLHLQNDNGSFPSSEQYPNSRVATGFALDFVGAATTEVLALGPGIEPALHQEVVDAAGKAAQWFLTDDEVWGAQGQLLSNQVVAGMVGISRIIYRYPDLRALFDDRVTFMAANLQSPAGYFYEGGVGNAYNLLVTSDDLVLWGDDATRPTVTAMQEEYVDWMQYAYVYDAGADAYLPVTALDTRHPRTFNDVVATDVGANGLWVPTFPQAAAYAPSVDLVDHRRDAFRTGTWKTVVSPEMTRVRGFLTPRTVRNVLAAEHYPTRAEKDAAIASLRPQASQSFTEHRADARTEHEFVFARRAPYLLGLAFGRQPVIPPAGASLGKTYVWDRVRFGLTHLSTPETGVVVQSQNAVSLRDPQDTAVLDELSWATVKADEDGAGFDVDAHARLDPIFRSAGATADPAKLGGDDFEVAYTVRGEAWLDKRVAITNQRPSVSVAVPGEFWEQIPLVLGPDDNLSWAGTTDTPTYGGTGQDTTASGFVVERGGHTIEIDWDAPRPVELDTVDPVACQCGLFEPVGIAREWEDAAGDRRRLHLLKVHATDALNYTFQLPASGDVESPDPEPQPEPSSTPEPSPTLEPSPTATTEASPTPTPTEDGDDSGSGGGDSTSESPSPSPTTSPAPSSSPTPDEPEPDGTVDRDASAGERVSTDTAGYGATPDVPVQTAVTTPHAGRVSVARVSGASTPNSYELLGHGVAITAPPATADDPLRIEFRLDGSVTTDVAAVTVFREGQPVPHCTEAGAVPDPCLASNGTVGDDLVLAVRTSAASTWLVTAGITLPICTSATSPFGDVIASSVHSGAIACVWERGLAHGVTAARYAPSTPVTRGQMASFLVRLLEHAGEVPAPARNAFPDDAGSTHEDAINRLTAMGIARGVTASSYAPDLPVTRAQMATFLVRVHEAVSGQRAPHGIDAFRDDDGDVHEASIDAASALGITTGVDSRHYAPAQPVRRDQLASFLVRTLESLFPAD